jgi:hypothetical protein
LQSTFVFLSIKAAGSRDRSNAMPRPAFTDFGAAGKARRLQHHFLKFFGGKFLLVVRNCPTTPIEGRLPTKHAK